MGAGVQRRWGEEEEEWMTVQILRLLQEAGMLARCLWCPGAVRLQPILPVYPCLTSSTFRVRQDRKEKEKREEKGEKATCWWPFARGSSSREPSPMIAPHHVSHDDIIYKLRIIVQHTCK